MENNELHNVYPTILRPKQQKTKCLYLRVNILIGMQLISYGMVIAFSEQLREKINVTDNSTDANRKFKYEEEALFASLIYTTILFGVYLAPLVFDWWGARVALLLNDLLGLLGWILIVLANGHTMLYLGRALHGLTLGITPVVCYTYLKQVTHSLKAKYIFPWIYTFINVGIILKYLIGVATVHNTWTVNTYVAMALFIMTFIATFLCLPESPKWLQANNKHTGETFVCLRLKMKELSEEHTNNQTKKTCCEIWKRLNEPEIRTKILQMVILLALLHFSGVYIYIFYNTGLLHDIDNIEDFITNESLEQLIYISVVCFTSIIANCFLQNVNRKFMLFISLLGMSVSLVVFTAAAFLHVPDETLSSLLTAMTFMYMVSAGLGFITIPWTMLTDVFPEDIRRYAARICVASFCLFGFKVTHLKTEIWVILSNIAFTLFATIFVCKWLPSNDRNESIAASELFPRQQETNNEVNVAI